MCNNKKSDDSNHWNRHTGTKHMHRIDRLYTRTHAHTHTHTQTHTLIAHTKHMNPRDKSHLLLRDRPSSINIHTVENSIHTHLVTKHHRSVTNVSLRMSMLYRKVPYLALDFMTVEGNSVHGRSCLHAENPTCRSSNVVKFVTKSSIITSVFPLTLERAETYCLHEFTHPQRQTIVCISACKCVSSCTFKCKRVLTEREELILKLVQ